MNNSKWVVKTAPLGISLVTLAAGLFWCNTGRSDNFAVVPAEYANTTAPGNGEIGEAINGSSSVFDRPERPVFDRPGLPPE
jgi:hypothetical protein